MLIFSTWSMCFLVILVFLKSLFLFKKKEFWCLLLESIWFCSHKSEWKCNRYWPIMIHMDQIFKISTREPLRMVDVTSVYGKIIFALFHHFWQLSSQKPCRWPCKARVVGDALALMFSCVGIEGWEVLRVDENRICPQFSLKSGTSLGRNNLTQVSQSTFKKKSQKSSADLLTLKCSQGTWFRFQ